MSLGSSLSSAQIYWGVWAQFHFSGPWLVKDPDCVCDCGERTPTDDDRRAPLDDEIPWTRCECKCCGDAGQGCRMALSEVTRICTARYRGRAEEVAQHMNEAWPNLSEDFKRENPKFCGDCMDHGVLVLRRAAVQKARERRAAASRERKGSKSKASDTTTPRKFARGQGSTG